MTDAMPSAVARYFAGERNRDRELALSAFSPTATVGDENRRHTGLAEIAAWIADTGLRYAPQTEIVSVTGTGDDVLVIGNVSGTFPGSPATLRFRFSLASDRIVRLEIGA